MRPLLPRALLALTVVLVAAPVAQAIREQTADYLRKAERAERRGWWDRAARYRMLAERHWKLISEPLFAYDVAYAKAHRAPMNAAGFRKERAHHLRKMRGNPKRLTTALAKAGWNGVERRAAEDWVRRTLLASVQRAAPVRNRQFGLDPAPLERKGATAVQLRRAADGRECLAWAAEKIVVRFADEAVRVLKARKAAATKAKDTALAEVTGKLIATHAKLAKEQRAVARREQARAAADRKRADTLDPPSRPAPRAGGDAGRSR